MSHRFGPDDPKRPPSVIDGEVLAPKPVPPQPVSSEEAERRRQRAANDRSAYQQQGLRPAGGEPWRGHVGGVDESFFWGGSTGKRAW